jgi:antirestriction protein ArdC
MMLTFFCEQNRYEHPLFATYKQIEEAGGNVKKGEVSFPVVYWKIFHKVAENEETGKEELQKRFTPFHYNVFNINQTEGIDIEKFIPDTSNRNNNPLELCESIVSNMPNPPRITHDKSGAFYSRIPDLVNVPEIRCFESSEKYYAVLFHELAHSTGHKSRLDRFQENDTVFGKKSYNFEELVAEMTATILCSNCGIDQTVENSVSYLTSWAKFIKDSPKSTLFKASTKAQMAASFILGKQLEFEEPEMLEAA